MSDTALSSDEELLQLIAENQYYPERLVMLLWEWDEGELYGIAEPDGWQMQDFRELGEEMRSRNWNGVDSAQKILRSLGSGRGIGKSADVSMTVVVLMAAFPDCKISIMANTGGQLDDKTWPEITKWLRRSIVAHWFEINTSIMYRKGARDSWFAVPVTWDIKNPQASAGQQNLGSANVIIFDEASEIPDKIAEVALSGLTTGLPICLARGNPTMATGFFADSLKGDYAFGYWSSRSIDSRTCRFPNKEELAEAIEEFGIDSDYVRVWILGLPPKSNMEQYFDEALIIAGMKARPVGTSYDALVAAWDGAWGGADPNTVRFRHGLDAHSIPKISVPGELTKRPEHMIGVLSNVLTKEYLTASGIRRKVDMLFMDSAGIAGPVALALRSLGFAARICEVNFGAHSQNMMKDKNMRAQMMRLTKELFQKGMGVDNCKTLGEDMRFMQPVNYVPLQFMKKELIRKKLAKVRKEGRTSTDDLDSLAMTTYMPVTLPEVERMRSGQQQEEAWRPASAYS